MTPVGSSGGRGASVGQVDANKERAGLRLLHEVVRRRVGPLRLAFRVGARELLLPDPEIPTASYDISRAGTHAAGDELRQRERGRELPEADEVTLLPVRAEIAPA